MGYGILSTGTMIPEMTRMGKIEKKARRSACWRFSARVPRKRPRPRLLNRKRAESAKKSRRLPRIGTRNHQGTHRARARDARLTTNVGITLETISSQGLKGK